MNILETKYGSTTVRIATDSDGNLWFCAKDAADAGGVMHGNARRFVSGLQPHDKSMLQIEAGTGTRSYSFISESAFYKMMFRARSLTAERFTDWVTREVLPTIRKTGGYGTQALPTRTEALRMALEASERADAAEAALAIAAPKAESYDRYLESDGCHTMANAAKILGLGRTRLFRKLREAGVIPADSTIPLQRYVDAGYFVIRAKVQELTDGTSRTYDAAAVTPKGLEWLSKKIGELKKV